MASKGYIYEIYFADTLAPAGFFSYFFDIIAPQRKISIKRIYLDINVYNITTGSSVPLEQNTAMGIELLLQGDVAGDLICNLFNVTPGPPAFDNGHFLRWFRPGQYEFSNLYIKNRASFRYSGSNDSDFHDHSISTQIIVESDQSIIY
jgi:hypothetical protein